MSLIKNSIWNVVGIGVPILIAIPAMGVLARLLGVEQFGLFTLAFAVIGYAGIFDAGLSRAVIRAIAIHTADKDKISKIIGSSTCFVLVLSIVASGILFISADRLSDFLSVSSASLSDAIRGFQWLSLAIPPLLLSTIWFSYLEGQSQFSKLNALKSVTGITLALFPLLLMLWEPSFTSAVLGLVVSRVLTALIAYHYALEDFKSKAFSFDGKTLKELIYFGGWLTVSNIISPIMVYFDRFFISNTLGTQAVAFYTAPAEIVARLLTIPLAVVRVIFPKLSARHLDAEQQARHAYILLLLTSVSISALIFIFAEFIISAWLGVAYLGETVIVLKILSIGFVFNAIAQIPYVRIQAAGYSRTTAMIHAAELIPYIVLLYFLVGKFSILGAAIAWTIRVAVDFAVMTFYAGKLKLNN